MNCTRMRVGIVIAAAAWAGIAAAGTPLTTVRIASNLANPVFVTHAPGDHTRLFILEQRGKIKIWKNGQILPTPFLEIATSLGFEQGLLGLAFHPDFATNRQFYINYTNPSGDTVIARYTVLPDNPDKADQTTPEDVILFHDQPFANHNGGWLGFGPDGYLYIALGDGGGQEDPDGRGQSITGELLGNILRIDVNGDDFPGDPSRDYAIPKDNPFVGVPGEDEIWAYGLRNPWRCAFDRLTGDFWIADVGEAQWEEVNFQPASSTGGENYGWKCREGTTCTTFGGCKCTTFSSIPPIHAYSHSSQPTPCSITGGEVYRGCALPDLSGLYFFADFCSAQIWTLARDGESVFVANRTAELTPAVGSIGSISSFGTDAAGEIYICDRASLTGEVYKIVPAGGPPELVSSDPPHLAIDARTPLAPDGVTKVGFTQVTFYFTIAAACSSPEHFMVEQLGGQEPAPQVVGVEAVGGNGLRVTLDRPIEPRAWTNIVHSPTQATVRLGYLPADVNGDRFSGPSDILALIDALNGVGPVLSIWSLDVDRSGQAGPSDILMVIDLLNGAGNLDSFLGAQLP